MTETRARPFLNGAPTTYKRLMLASGMFAGIALGLGAALDRPLYGVAFYVVGLTSATAIPYLTDHTLFDERDDAIHERASGLTLALFGWLAALIFPSLVLLSSTEYFSWGPASVTLAWTTAIVYITYGLALGYYRYQ